MTEQLLRIADVKLRTGLSRSMLYRLMQEHRFPAPIAIESTRVRAWPSSEIDAWIARQIAASRQPGQV